MRKQGKRPTRLSFQMIGISVCSRSIHGRIEKWLAAKERSAERASRSPGILPPRREALFAHLLYRRPFEPF